MATTSSLFKRSNDQQHVFASALVLLLSKCAPLRERDTLQRLLLVSKATRAAVVAWLQEAFALDISTGIERLPVPVCGGDGNSEHVSSTVGPSNVVVQDLLELLGFQYAVQCKYPIPPHQHALSAEGTAAALRGNLAQRVLRGRTVRVTVTKRRLSDSSKGMKGWSVLAAEDIACGEYIGEYTGDIVSTHQMQARFLRTASQESGMNYVLVLRERASRLVDGSDSLGASFSALRTIVDATDRGSFTRLINHSCEPNLALTTVRLRSLIPHLVLFAKRDVKRGEELSFDYGDGGGSAAAAGETPAVRIDKEGCRRCLCAAAGCRGFLPSDSSV